MDATQLARFKQVLTLQLELLTNQAGQVISELKESSDQEIEQIDMASAHLAQSMKLHIRSRESRLINKLLMALERIDNQTFGICETCGEEISLRRLEARPVTTKCIECKEEEERQELLTH